MSKKADRRVPEEQAATVAQVLAAIEAMTAGDAARLKGFAASKWRVRGHLPDGRDGDDLLSAAVVTALAGRRRWNPSKVSFPTLPHRRNAEPCQPRAKARVTDILQVALSESDLVTPEDPISARQHQSSGPVRFRVSAER